MEGVSLTCFCCFIYLSLAGVKKKKKLTPPVPSVFLPLSHCLSHKSWLMSPLRYFHLNAPSTSSMMWKMTVTTKAGWSESTTPCNTNIMLMTLLHYHWWKIIRNSVTVRIQTEGLILKFNSSAVYCTCSFCSRVINHFVTVGLTFVRYWITRFEM